MGIRHRVDQFTKDGEFITTYESVNEASIITGVDNIKRSLDHPSRMEGGFKWKKAIEQPIYYNYRGKTDYTDEQREYFNIRIPKYMPVLYNVARNLPFITPWNKQDYIQEALIHSWLNFYTYEPAINDGKKFGSWIKVVGRSGMYQCYYKFFKGWYIRELDPERTDIPDDEVDESREAKILALYQSLDCLSLKDREIAILFMNSVPGAEAAEKAGMKQDTYYKKVQQLKGILKEKIEFFLFGIKATQKPFFGKGKFSRDPMPVEQYDLLGKFITKFPTIESTRAAGFDPSAVSGVINKRTKTHRGYMWKLAKN